MRKKGNILILTQWSFKDALVQTYTIPYVDIIRRVLQPSVKIYVVTAEKQNIVLSPEEKLKLTADWEKKNMFLVPYIYKNFGLKKLLLAPTQLIDLCKIIKLKKISTIHAFCTPAGGIGYLLSKITGADLIIDSYEPHADTMVENGTWKKKGPEYILLSRLEKLLSRKAIHLIGTTAGMRDYAYERFGIKLKSFFVKPACVDLKKFSPEKGLDSLKKELGLAGKIVCVFAGKLGGIYLKDEVFDFIRSCYDHWGDKFRFIMLSDTPAEEIEKQLKRTGIPHNVIIARYVFHEQVPAFMALADFALNPVKPVPTKKYCTSIKDGEYWAMGLPVIIPPNISDDSDIISREKVGVILEGFNKNAYDKAVNQMDILLQGDREKLKTRIRGLAIKYRSFEGAENIYKQIYLV